MEVKSLAVELSTYPWDSEKELIELTSTQLIKVLEHTINDEIEIQALIEWANLIELREDIAMSNFAIEVVTTLANPELTQDGITKELIHSLIQTLK